MRTSLGLLLLLVSYFSSCLGQQQSRRPSRQGPTPSRSRPSGSNPSRSTRRGPAPNTTEVPIDCDISDATALSNCLRLLLLDKRWDVAREAEPLLLPDELFKTPGWLKISGARLGGLSCYEIDDLQLTFPQDMSIAVDARLSWKNIVGVTDVKALGVMAKPIITVGSVTGRLQTTLKVTINSDGELSVTPSSTEVTVDLHDIDVPTARIRSGVLRTINFIFGDPASSQIKKAVTRQWTKNKNGLQKQAAEELDRLIVNNLAVHLGGLLQLRGSSRSRRAAVARSGSRTRIRSGQCYRSINFRRGANPRRIRRPGGGPIPSRG